MRIRFQYYDAYLLKDKGIIFSKHDIVKVFDPLRHELLNDLIRLYQHDQKYFIKFAEEH